MDIEEFLLNPDVNDLVFEDTYNHKKIHKEQFDDRFVLYILKQIMIIYRRMIMK